MASLVPPVVAACEDPDIRRWHVRTVDLGEALGWTARWHRRRLRRGPPSTDRMRLSDQRRRGERVSHVRAVHQKRVQM